MDKIKPVACAGMAPADPSLAVNQTFVSDFTTPTGFAFSNVPLRPLQSSHPEFSVADHNSDIPLGVGAANSRGWPDSSPFLRTGEMSPVVGRQSGGMGI